MRVWAQCVMALCLLLLAGCMTTPVAEIDTDKKRIAAFEISLQEAISAAVSLRSQGLLSDESVKQLDALFSRIEMARFLMYQALSQENSDGVSEYLSTAQKVLVAVNAIIQGTASNAAKRSYGRAATYITD